MTQTAGNRMNTSIYKAKKGTMFTLSNSVQRGMYITYILLQSLVACFPSWFIVWSFMRGRLEKYILWIYDKYIVSISTFSDLYLQLFTCHYYSNFIYFKISLIYIYLFITMYNFLKLQLSNYAGNGKKCPNSRFNLSSLIYSRAIRYKNAESVKHWL